MSPISNQSKESADDALIVQLEDAGGTNVLTVTAAGAAKVDGSAVTQPVSAVSLPLPTDASTSAKQDVTNAAIAATGANSPASAIQVGASDGATPSLLALQGRVTTPASNTYGLVTRPLPNHPDTIYVAALGVAIGNGKSMLSVLNAGGSTVKLKLQKLYIYNVQTSAVTGVIAEFQMRFHTGHSAGTQLTTTPAAAGRLRMADTTDSLNASVTFRTGATLTAEESFALKRWLWSSDEFGTGTADAETAEHTSAQLIAAYQPVPNAQPITLNAGQGMTIRQNTNSTNGTFDIIAIFTQEVA